ncbi:cytochrome c oxidase subunit II [Paraburkholderia steynii]|uniref:Cytochrome aa3 subunit 2 n=1 Tax=Paraburkholderia steynii TaxID=1245441 RepID=A0A4R0XEZ2_9BURK|nr:cytochrome c oxidase subunit II [Paraburkholderia steynii]
MLRTSGRTTSLVSGVLAAVAPHEALALDIAKGEQSEGRLPLAYFLHEAGPAALPVLRLGWALAALCVGVCLVIAFLLAVSIWRRSRASARDGISAGGGTGIVWIGTAISTVLLMGVLIYMLWVLAQVADPPQRPLLTVTVTAYDWWWKVDYGDDEHRFSTANEIHIPVGQPVLFRLKSADVIHAFWVPELSGKTQNIPGQINQQWIQADRPGTYRGQCTQFCGPQHAHMAFEIVAEPPQTACAADLFLRPMTARPCPAQAGDRDVPARFRTFLFRPNRW